MTLHVPCPFFLAKPWLLSDIKMLRASGVWPNPVINRSGVYPVFRFNIPSSVANFNLLAYLIAHQSYDGTSPCFVEITINPSVLIYSTDPSVPAFDTGIMPANSILVIQGQGVGAAIQGAGGVGGNGGNTAHPNGYNGGAGGTAVKSNISLYLDASLLSVWAGGGAGGGGGLQQIGSPPAPAPGPAPTGGGKPPSGPHGGTGQGDGAYSTANDSSDSGSGSGSASGGASGGGSADGQGSGGGGAE